MGFLYKTTTSDFSSGPPSNPSTGDIWIASNVDGNGTRWQFQYNAGSVSAYKWEFIGGPPVFVAVDTFETTTTAWPNPTDLTTVGPSFTCARAGEYSYIFNVRANNNTTGIASVAVVTSFTGAAAINDSVQVVVTSSTASADNMGMEQGKVPVDAGGYIKLRYCTLSSGTSRFGQRRLFITPVRVS